jgi:hypothetical protein
MVSQPTPVECRGYQAGVSAPVMVGGASASPAV